ncbi:MAG: tRNA (adenosine(37)-N6)-threonylcarbamoyltransferase complex ATPase subunit type 1 TsaE [Pseudomonadota bacterium]
MNLDILTRSGEETQALGKALGQLLEARTAIRLIGELAAGKTTFVQGLARGLGVPETYPVTSPTYTLVNEYPGRIPLFHLDLYRLSSPDELDDIGFDDIAASESVIVVEWPEMIDASVLSFNLSVFFSIDIDFNRKISIIASGLGGANLLRSLSAVVG